MTRILFVCTGNVLRSVLAERLLAARLPPGSALWPESAGTEARCGSRMKDDTRAILEKLGGDGSGFASRPLTAQLIAGASLILGLTREHREAAVRLVPTAMRRCFTLKEFVRLAEGGGTRASGGNGLDPLVAAAAGRRGAEPPVPPPDDNIRDPWGLPWKELHECALEIDKAVIRFIRL
ncbi:low molecular weight phosphatase family protein [Streptomyces sp. NPDC086787]|uniref:arsenate reductase/protein-tyrosine-phosphatase family protein n=1 Tax=Streptomyces sp. NPDC086787 TaxID=3365759 RepID=UPI0038145F09